MGRRRRRSAQRFNWWRQFKLEPETKRGIVVVICFLLAAVLVLSLFGAAGYLGAFLDRGLASTLGKLRPLLVPVLIVAGLQTLFPEKHLARSAGILGIGLAFLSLSGLLHAVIIGTAAERPLEEAGGALGALIYQSGHFIAGAIATSVILTAIFAASLILIFRLSVVDLARRCSTLLLAVKPRDLFKTHYRGRSSEPEEVVGDEVEEDHDEEDIESDADEERELEVVEVETASGISQSNAPVEIATSNNTASPAPKTSALVRPRERRSISIPLDLLDGSPSRPTSGDIEHNTQVIEKTLANFGVQVEMGEVLIGPTVTQYSFKPADGIKLTRITALANDLSLALAAHPIRMEAPIPGKSLVGLEVPNKSVATVRLREIVGSKVFQSDASPLTCALGKDVSGKPYVTELDKMPHLLVAGATGSGKSVCLNSIIVSLMYKTSPDDLKFILIDPKRVEMPMYNGMPYLLTPVITDIQKTINALKWTVQEMERRYERLSAFGARDIKAYNERAEDGMPYLVLIIDELADIMQTAIQEVEGSIVRLAQMARAVGIHLILATQRPSVNVITGLIKANIPGRIAFAVSSAIDSRTILDAQGAEKLLGRGDMLYSTSDLGKPKRIQGAYVADAEIKRVVEFVKNTGATPDYDVSVVERQSYGGVVMNDGDASGDDTGDALFEDAMRVVGQAGKASASLLQRRLKVGYSRAARLLDILEEQGIIGPSDGAKPRAILRKDIIQAAADDGEATESADDADRKV